MTQQEYYKIREKIGIKQQVQTFLKYVMDMCEIYPQFNQMTLDEIYEYLNQKETVWELEIKNDLNVK
ncbi:hypothetical protein [Clostridium sp.]|uniref:hypothetical protein n=1 Tax=Clostridium sp. TaxID=1506 RepID=UPI0025C482C4|nr:hypothetical protein [Clostridium sp.]